MYAVHCTRAHPHANMYIVHTASYYDDSVRRAIRYSEFSAAIFVGCPIRNRPSIREALISQITHTNSIHWNTQKQVRRVCVRVFCIGVVAAESTVEVHVVSYQQLIARCRMQSLFVVNIVSVPTHFHRLELTEKCDANRNTPICLHSTSSVLSSSFPYLQLQATWTNRQMGCVQMRPAVVQY